MHCVGIYFGKCNKLDYGLHFRPKANQGTCGISGKKSGKCSINMTYSCRIYDAIIIAESLTSRGVRLID